MVKIVAIVQARTGSVRLPGKVMRPLAGTPAIDCLIQRLARANLITDIIMATTVRHEDDEQAQLVENMGVGVFRGSEHDVLDRYYQAARSVGASIVVRITGDCPLVDPELVDAVIAALQDGGFNYALNTEPPTFPDGLDVEAFTFNALESAWTEPTDPSNREHVTAPIVRATMPDIGRVTWVDDLSAKRWALDEPEDLTVLDRVFRHFRPRMDFGWKEVLQMEKTVPEWFADNRSIGRNMGAEMGSGQKLWRRARRVIAGGNMLLSKRPDMLPSELWPTYYSKAEGCTVRDLDGRKYTDMSLMGVSTNILGYAHPVVDAAVRKAVDAGNMPTLNCPEEVLFAELEPVFEQIARCEDGLDIMKLLKGPVCRIGFGRLN